MQKRRCSGTKLGGAVRRAKSTPARAGRQEDRVRDPGLAVRAVVRAALAAPLEEPAVDRRVRSPAAAVYAPRALVAPHDLHHGLLPIFSLLLVVALLLLLLILDERCLTAILLVPDSNPFGA